MSFLHATSYLFVFYPLLTKLLPVLKEAKDCNVARTCDHQKKLTIENANETENIKC